MFRVSVIVPTYNRAQFLGASLDSLLTQTRPLDEVIVVNDGSGDATADVLRGYDDRIAVIDQDNAGKAAALNRALPRASGDLLWVFDDDDVAFPDALARHLDVFARQPAVDFTYSPARRLDTDPEGHETEGPMIAVPDMSREGVFYHLQSGGRINQQGAVVRRTVQERVGGFDEALHRTQDYDFLLRLSRVSTGYHLGAPTFHFRRHAGPRGGAGARHDVAARERTFFAYERRIWGRLLPTLSEAELLPAHQNTQEASPARARQACLRRLMIAGRFGLHDTVLTAAAALAEGRGPAGALNAWERQSAWLTFARPQAALHAAGQPGFFEDLRDCLAHTGQAHGQIALFLALGLHAAARTLAAQGERDAAARLRAARSRLVLGGGWRFLPGYLADKLRVRAAS